MKAGHLNELARCVELAISSDEEVELLGDADQPASALFLLAFSRLVLRFGEPDHPGGELDWPEELDLEGELIALWDFDYYQLSLRLLDAGQRELVVLRKHETGASPDH